MTPTQAAAIRTWQANQRRVIDEYAAVPSTTRQVNGPCIRGCGRIARTQRGVCRHCLAAERKP